MAPVVTTVKATAAAAKPSTRAGLSATKLPMLLISGVSPVISWLTAGNSAWPIFSDTPCRASSNCLRWAEVSPRGTCGALSWVSCWLLACRSSSALIACLMPWMNGSSRPPPLMKPPRSREPRPLPSMLFLKAPILARIPDIWASSFCAPSTTTDMCTVVWMFVRLMLC